MGPIGWTWVLVAASFGLYAGIALYTRARSLADYYVADRAVHPVVSGMATGADWMSAASFMSMAGILAFTGRDGAAYLMGWTGGYVLLAVLLAPYLRKYGKYTVPQFVGDRYYSRSARAVATVCALVVSFTYVAAQVRGVGIVLARFLELPIGGGVALAIAIVFFYAVLGGMKGITYVQVAQYLVLIVAFLVPAVLVSQLLTGNPVPALGLGGRLTEGGAALLGVAPGRHLLDALDAIGSDLGLGRFTAGSRPRLDVLATTAALMIGTAGLPHIIIRFFTVPKIRDARASAGWALLFIAVLYTAAPAVAAFGRGLLVATVEGVPHAEAPSWFRAWERTGLVAWTDRNGDGVMQLSGDPSRNEVRVDGDVIVLAHPEMARLPAWVVGLVAAGALAAGLSTAAGLLLVIAAGFSHDLVRGVVAPRLSDRAELGWARGAAAAAALGAGYFALRPPGSVAEVVAIAFGLAASSFFPVLVLGIFWRRATREGAIAGMVAGLLVTSAYVVWFRHLHPELNGPEHWWLGISPEGIGALGTLVNAAVLTAVSLATPAPPREVQELVASLRYPREPAPARAAASSRAR
ncbi:sodium:solute symporter family protein [Anaeromyxobacter terrae]|uniref:sodium:solute symporter family protein n=1 Tax=Anaeromyxobacter terrae TaxID=2925406 RepID=UPI001F564DF4|nr:sodium:solute symporter family protein [Anaeromyxobacter sp. SG22]